MLCSRSLDAAQCKVSKADTTNYTAKTKPGHTFVVGSGVDVVAVVAVVAVGDVVAVAVVVAVGFIVAVCAGRVPAVARAVAADGVVAVSRLAIDTPATDGTP